MRGAVHQHIGEEVGLVHLTSLGARGSDANRDFVFHQVCQMIARTVPGVCFDAEIPVFIRPRHAIINEKDIDSMTFGMGDSGEMKTSGGRSIVIPAQGKQKVRRHNQFSSPKVKHHPNG